MSDESESDFSSWRYNLFRISHSKKKLVRKHVKFYTQNSDNISEIYMVNIKYEYADRQ